MTQAVPPRAPRIFNSPIEYGLRMLFILDAAGGRPADLQRLISYDYLIVHSGDVENGPSSLHPAVPYRGGEFLIRRDLVTAGLNHMFSRELIVKRFDTSGITYRSNELTGAFLRLLKSSYAESLRSRAKWLIERFGAMEDDRLSAYMTEQVGRWGTEFHRSGVIEKLVL